LAYTAACDQLIVPFVGQGTYLYRTGIRVGFGLFCAKNKSRETIN